MKRQIFAYATLACLYLFIFSTSSALLAISFHLLIRIFYMGYVSYSLKRQEEEKVFTRVYGIYDGFENFKFPASILMNNDAVSFCLMAYLTRGSFETSAPAFLISALGITLIILGGGAKLWAAEVLGSKGYFWGDFFMPVSQLNFDEKGPYRYLESPMYTLGYAQAYGLALFLFSWPGLVLAFVDQASVLFFNFFVEKPHVLRVKQQETAQQDVREVPAGAKVI